MRQIICKFNTLGAYETKDNTSFGGENKVKVIVKPHDFSIKISGEVLRSSFCPRCTAVVSRDGAVIFYDGAGNVIGSAAGGEETYPNCDGEYDRWSTEWQTRRSVTMDLILFSNYDIKF